MRPDFLLDGDAERGLVGADQGRVVALVPFLELARDRRAPPLRHPGAQRPAQRLGPGHRPAPLIGPALQGVREDRLLDVRHLALRHPADEAPAAGAVLPGRVRALARRDPGRDRAAARAAGCRPVHAHSPLGTGRRKCATRRSSCATHRPRPDDEEGALVVGERDGGTRAVEAPARARAIRASVRRRSSAGAGSSVSSRARPRSCCCGLVSGRARRGLRARAGVAYPLACPVDVAARGAGHGTSTVVPSEPSARAAGGFLLSGHRARRSPPPGATSATAAPASIRRAGNPTVRVHCPGVVLAAVRGCSAARRPGTSRAQPASPARAAEVVAARRPRCLRASVAWAGPLLVSDSFASFTANARPV